MDSELEELIYHENRKIDRFLSPLSESNRT